MSLDYYRCMSDIELKEYFSSIENKIEYIRTNIANDYYSEGLDICVRLKKIDVIDSITYDKIRFNTDSEEEAHWHSLNECYGHLADDMCMPLEEYLRRYVDEI